MVQLMSPAMAESEGKCRKRVAVKLEAEDSTESRIGTPRKRPKLDSFSQVWKSGNGSFPITPTTYDPLDEPSPLGLRLRKSPSLLELIQMKLSQPNGDKKPVLGKKSQRASAIPIAMDKLKASNFPASILRIGTWEYKSRYEGDLVGKCYFAKHKLVWEVLDGTLKNKIEIQWSDIEALKANYPDDGPGTLDVVLVRQPLFFREINPQPRKHTLWQATSDFTGGQASIYRRHFVQCPPGLLRKHFEKLIQCDSRLNFLSHQPDIIVENPYFETIIRIKGDQNELCHEFDVKRDDGPAFLGLQDTMSSGAQSSSRNDVSQETHSPNQEIESSGAENSKLGINWDQLKVPGLHPSMSISDLVSHIGNCLTEKMTCGNPISGTEQHSKDIMEEVTQYLFSDSQFLSTSNEQALMKKVNSLCCLLQKDSFTAQNMCANIEDNYEGRKIGVDDSTSTLAYESKVFQGENDDIADRKQAQVMSRKDSFGELLLTLPRIASLPQFLFNLSSQDSDNEAR